MGLFLARTWNCLLIRKLPLIPRSNHCDYHKNVVFIGVSVALVSMVTIGW